MQFLGGKMKLRTPCLKKNLRGKPLRLFCHGSPADSCSEGVLNKCLILNYAGSGSGSGLYFKVHKTYISMNKLQQI